MRELRFMVALFGTLFVLSGCPSSDDDDVAGDDDDVASDDDDVASDDDDAADDDAVDDDDDAVGDDDDASDPVVTATVTVPAGFDDMPVNLFVGYLGSFDDEDPVVGHGLEIEDPDIGDGNPLDIVATQDGLVGEYIIVVVLYVEGGAPDGEGWPVEGVDHAWYAENQALGSGDVHLGTIEVIPWVMPQ